MTVATEVFLVKYVLIGVISCLKSTIIQNMPTKLYHFSPLASISLSSKEKYDALVSPLHPNLAHFIDDMPTLLPIIFLFSSRSFEQIHLVPSNCKKIIHVF